MSKPTRKKRITMSCKTCYGAGEIEDPKVGKKSTDMIPCPTCKGNRKKIKNNRNKFLGK